MGVRISIDPKITIKNAKASILRNVGTMRHRLRLASVNVKEKVLTAYTRSLIVYFGTPLFISGLWKEQDIMKLEKHVYRKLMGAPTDISGQLILNIA